MALFAKLKKKLVETELGVKSLYGFGGLFPDLLLLQ